MDEFSIVSENLSCKFGKIIAVDNLNLQIKKGVFYGFVGPNGAGKSTTIKMLTGLLTPTSGNIKILGNDVWKYPVKVKRQIGVVPEDLNLFERLTGWEYLTFIGRLYNLNLEVIADRSKELIEIMELVDKKDALIVDYSHGMKKKLSIAAALIHTPKVLFLDEPFEGIDAISSKSIKDILNNLVKKDVTIFLTSHILEIVEKLCDEIGIINKGKLIINKKISDLKLSDIDLQEEISLEEVFLNLVSNNQEKKTLSWIN